MPPRRKSAAPDSGATERDVAPASAALRAGFDYQDLFAWHRVLELRGDEAESIQWIGIERPENHPVDDVTIIRKPNSPKPSEYWQVKFHVNHRQQYTHLSLARRAGKAKHSLLGNLVRAWRSLSPEWSPLVVGLLSNWQLSSADSLAPFIGSEYALTGQFFRPNQQARAVLECWCREIGCTERDLLPVLQDLRLKLGFVSEAELRETVRMQMRLAGLRGGEAHIAAGIDIVKGWIKAGPTKIDGPVLDAALRRYQLLGRDAAAVSGVDASIEVERKVTRVKAIAESGQTARVAHPVADAAFEQELQELLSQGRARIILGALIAPARKTVPGHLTDYQVAAYSGLALRMMHRRRAAAKALALAVKLEPTRAQAHANLAVALFECGNAEAAERAIERCLKLDAANVTAHDVLFHIQCERGLWKVAAATVRRTGDRRARTHRTAELHLRQGRSARARQLLTPLAKAGDDPEACTTLARILAAEARSRSEGEVPWGSGTKKATRQLQKALEYANTAVSILSSRAAEDALADALVLRVLLHQQLGEAKPAEDVGVAVSIAPGNPTVAMRAAGYWAASGQVASARALIRSLGSLRQEVPEWAVVEARCLQMEGHFARLLRFVRRPRVRSLLSEERAAGFEAEAFIGMGQGGSALAALEGTRATPPSAEWVMAYARTLESTDQYEAAIRVLAEASSTVEASDRWKLALVAGGIHGQRGHWQEAAESYGAIVSPQAFADVVSMYCTALYNADKVGACISFGVAAIKAQGLKREYADTLGEAFLALGLMTAAEKTFRALCEFEPESVQAVTGLARVLASAGKYSEAVRVLGDPEWLARASIKVAEPAVEILALFGRAADALRTAALILKRNPDSLEAHRLYLKAFFHAAPRAEASWMRPDQAQVETVVVCVGASGSELVRIVPDALWNRRADGLRQRDALERGVLGLARGDSVLLESGSHGQVKDVHNYYALLAGEVQAAIVEKFPGQTLLRRVSDDAVIAEVARETEAKAQFKEAAERFYTNELPPLALMGGSQEPDALKGWYAFISRELKPRLLVGRPSSAEWERAVNNIGKRAIVLDITALLALMELGLLETLQAKVADVLVAQPVMDVLENAWQERVHASLEQRGSAQVIDGKLQVEMVTKEHASKAAFLFRSTIDSVRKRWHVVGVDPALGDGRRAAARLISEATADSILVARRHNACLVVDDIFVRDLVERAGGRSSSSVAACEAWRRRGVLSASSCARALAVAAVWGYEYIPPGGGALKAALELDGGELGAITRAVLERFGEPGPDERDLLRSTREALAVCAAMRDADIRGALREALRERVMARAAGMRVWQAASK